MIDASIAALVQYAVDKRLIEESDRTWAENRVLGALGVSEYERPETIPAMELEEILKTLLDDAEARGIISGGVTERDLLDTELMGRLTPRPSQVISEFKEKLADSPKAATDWFYGFCQDTDYIRRYRIARDVKWVTSTAYGLSLIHI